MVSAYKFHNIFIMVALIAPPSGMRVDIDHVYTVKPLLTPTEAQFHDCLEALTQARCRIQVKPRLADVFQHHGSGFQQISQKHVDFLVCRNDDWTPMLAIELDDDSHRDTDRKKRDMSVNALFASTGIPLVRIHVRDMDKMEELVLQLTRAWEHRWQLLSALAEA